MNFVDFVPIGQLLADIVLVILTIYLSWVTWRLYKANIAQKDDETAPTSGQDN